MPTNVYVDGFNLYYGAVRGTSYKWLDLGILCAKLLPGRSIKRIRYFTATPRGLPHNPDVHIRHAIYIRALKTIPNLEVHPGQFLDREAVLPQFPFAYHNYADPSKHPPLMVRVMRSEEKRSDVNIATYLLLDCFQNEFDEAVIISNDSDLSEPIKVVTRHFRKQVTVINPQRRGKIRWELKQAASSIMPGVNPTVLANSQFPPTITDTKGTFSKPPTW